ncbi:MAG: flavin reductase family protein [Terriglobales bacterium]
MEGARAGAFFLPQDPRPMTVSKESFRKTLGKFASGVTVVTVDRSDGKVHGMTANAFSSVSLDPLLALVCLDHRSRTLPLVQKQKRFGVNVLGQHQRAVADYYARSSQDHETGHRLGIRYTFTKRGTPLIEHALAQFDCKLAATHVEGDHTIVIGEVEQAAVHEGRPLLFFGGKYHTLGGVPH